MNAEGPLGGLRVLFLPHPTQSHLYEPWGKDAVAALRVRNQVAVYDAKAELQPQLTWAEVVVDHGGSSGSREMVDATSGLRLWQILGTGIDHFDLDYWRSRGIPVANCPGTFTAAALADCALMFMLMLARRYRTLVERMQTGEYYGPAGIELRGRSLVLTSFA